MDNLISRQAAIDSIKETSPAFFSTYKHNIYIDKQDAISRLIARPSVQPEQKKGKWEITDAYPHNVYCSECHRRYAQTHWSVWEDGSLPRNYCPNCGAYMETDK